MKHHSNVDIIVNSMMGRHDAEEWRHFKRVESLSTMTARVMGWNKDDIEELRLAALYHHLDQTNLPGSSLSTEVAEFLNEYNKREDDLFRWRTACENSRAQQAAVIIALADRFDCLTSDQNYRRALDDADALEILEYDAETDLEITAVNAMRRAYEGVPVVRLAKAA